MGIRPVLLLENVECEMFTVYSNPGVSVGSRIPIRSASTSLALNLGFVSELVQSST
jgi:hypothetical protein